MTRRMTSNSIEYDVCGCYQRQPGKPNGDDLKEAVALQKILDNAERGEFLMFYRGFVELGQIIERMK